MAVLEYADLEAFVERVAEALRQRLRSQHFQP